MVDGRSQQYFLKMWRTTVSHEKLPLTEKKTDNSCEKYVCDEKSRGKLGFGKRTLNEEKYNTQKIQIVNMQKITNYQIQAH